MIAWLSGTLRRKATDGIVVEVAGVGYQLSVPLSTFSMLPDLGIGVSLHVHTHLREDALSLFGFSTELEKDLFALLLGVSGIGPKLALAVLSGLSAGELIAAIRAGEDTKLCGIPGVGRKTAARLCLELRDKVTQLVPQPEIPVRPLLAASPEINDAVSALVNLGYKRQHAEEVVRLIGQTHPDLSVAPLIRKALGILAQR
jgi:Holliday junction DNA helicase RuvA